MTEKSPFAHRLRVAHLNARAGNPVALAPDAAARTAIADDLGLLDLPALSFDGTITAQGADSWALEGQLRARITQACVVTLAPVETKIDDTVRRIFTPHLTPPEDEEIEMPDDALEPLGAFIDAGAVMVEALALALPLYPRAPDAALPASVAAETDTGTGTDGETRKPFAGLADLLKRGDETA